MLAVARKMTAFLVVSGNRGLSISRVFRRGRYRVCSEVLRPRCAWDDQYLRSCRSMHVDVLTMHAITIRWTYFSTDSSSAQVRQMQSRPGMHAPRCLWVCNLPSSGRHTGSRTTSTLFDIQLARLNLDELGSLLAGTGDPPLLSLCRAVFSSSDLHTSSVHQQLV